METTSLYNELARLMNPEDAAQVLSALRQDAFIWQRVQQPAFLQSVVKVAGKIPERWNPGTLALLAMGIEEEVEAYRAQPITELVSPWQERAMQAYQSAHAAPNAGPSTLEEAGLLALALREKRRKAGSWASVASDIHQRAGIAGETHPGWRTAVAILASLSPETAELLRALLPRQAGRQSFEWALHAVLCQPLAARGMADIFVDLLKSQALDIQAGAARGLNLHGRAELAASVAEKLAADHPAFATLRTQTGLTRLDMAGLVARAFMLHQLGSLYQVAGNRSQALSFLHSAEGTLKQWLAGLYLQEMNITGFEDPDGAYPKDEGLKSESRVNAILTAARRIPDELGPVLSGLSGADDLVDKLSEGSDPILQIVRAARLDEQGETVMARDLAGQGVKRLVEKVNQTGLPFWGDYVYQWQPKMVVQTLIEMGMEAEALQLAKSLLSARPVDTVLLEQASAISEKAGDDAAALQYAQASALLEPQEASWHRRLGSLHMKAQAWQQAHADFEKVMTLSDPPSLQDRIQFARSAVLSGALRSAVETCDHILESNPDNGEAAALEGQALAALGDTERAISLLNRATQSLPENPVPWLILAHLQQERGDQQIALQTLRSASKVVTDSAAGAGDIYLALGETCLDQALDAEALPALEKAYKLSPSAVKPAFLYGKALRSQGRSVEAQSVLEGTRYAWEEQPEMAFEFARAAQESGDFRAMIPALDSALKPPRAMAKDLPFRAPLDWLLLYARLLLGELPGSGAVVNAALTADARANRAERSLKEILDRDPDHYDARFFLGQVHLTRGEPAEALEIFTGLAENPAVQKSDLYWRVQWGLGKAAVQLCQCDLGLASLKEAAQKRPDRLDLQRDLAEASAGANLRNEALSAARAALQLAPDGVDNLVWYAGFTNSLGERKAAMSALECAVQLEPANPALRVGLADHLIASGDRAAAHSSLDVLAELSPVCLADLRRASAMYLQLDDQPAALKCLQRALEQETNPSLQLQYDVAALQEKLSEYEAALATTQKALSNPVQAQRFEHVPFYMLQSNLLSRLNRAQAALASLEMALRIAEERQAVSDGGAKTKIDDLLTDLHDRLSALLSSMGQTAEAFDHADKALDMHPERLPLRTQAAGLALAMLQIDRAQVIANSEPTAELLPDRYETDGLDFLCLRIEIALQAELDPSVLPVKVERMVEKGIYQSNRHPRLMAAKARCLARQGDLMAAIEAYDAAQRLWKEQNPNEKPGIWMAEAALESQRWDDAARLSEAYTRLHPGEARGQYVYLKSLVTCAERMLACETVGCQAHAPGLQAISTAARQAFEQAGQAAASLVNNQAAGTSEIQRWMARGQAIFNPTVQTARDLSNLAASPQGLPHDTAALVGVLRLLKRVPSALQSAQPHLEDPRVAFQAALCSLGDHAPKENLPASLALARRLVQEYPSNPLHHALLARLAAESGETGEALSAYESALRWWPSEAAWHDEAGDLAFKLDDDLSGMMHREQALALEPANVSYALKLGEASLMQENVSRAVEVLEMASRIRADELQVWQALSIAYRQAGRLPQALEAALQAAQLAPDSGKSYLLAGETALALQQPDQAIEYARKAVLREPENVRAVLFLSQLLAQAGKSGEALESLETAPAAIRGAFEIAFERARLIYRFHGGQAAIEPLEKLAVEYPDEPELLAFLASAHAESGNIPAAQKHGFKSLRLNAAQPDLSYMLGCWQHKSGQLDQAVHLLSEAIRLSPSLLEAYLELGAVYLERREPQQALQAFKQATRLAPADYRAFYQCGLILRDAKDYVGAESMLRKAADLAPKDSTVRRQLVAVITLNLVHNKQEVN